VSRIDPPNILCPSAFMKEGVVLLGVVMADGRVAFAANRLVTNSEFVANAREGRAPEKRFRFADACAQAGCVQWTGKRCGVIDNVLAELPTTSLQSQLPQCSIRPQCRWYFQAGAEACHACPVVITDCRKEHAAGADTTSCEV
jgi:hypothetical protein